MQNKMEVKVKEGGGGSYKLLFVGPYLLVL